MKYIRITCGLVARKRGDAEYIKHPPMVMCYERATLQCYKSSPVLCWCHLPLVRYPSRTLHVWLAALFQTVTVLPNTCLMHAMTITSLYYSCTNIHTYMLVNREQHSCVQQDQLVGIKFVIDLTHYISGRYMDKNRLTNPLITSISCSPTLCSMSSRMSATKLMPPNWLRFSYHSNELTLLDRTRFAQFCM